MYPHTIILELGYRMDWNRPGTNWDVEQCQVPDREDLPPPTFTTHNAHPSAPFPPPRFTILGLAVHWQLRVLIDPMNATDGKTPRSSCTTRPKFKREVRPRLQQAHRPTVPSPTTPPRSLADATPSALEWRRSFPRPPGTRATDQSPDASIGLVTSDGMNGGARVVVHAETGP
ncbi:uncharacterized protein N7482_008085 [Penicillium canariense]|uniref:Uncharacterized protein n=1 Tax=Penicillium canariense TaxID=189055 RepID=A0A9W9LIM6_9EURO|nr:uncharacterized protein N7482_008085 [Penicillium canariense]KAJ5156985.1 hypothetical protein N7482_008085 [Penicillium canariense]